MRPVMITLTAGTLVLLLSGCPDIPAGGVPGHDTAVRRGDHPASRSRAQRVEEIAWFQGTIDEAFSRRGCTESHPRRTLFRF